MADVVLRGVSVVLRLLRRVGRFFLIDYIVFNPGVFLRTRDFLTVLESDFHMQLIVIKRYLVTCMILDLHDCKYLALI